MDASYLGQVGAGVGALLAGGGIGAVKLVEAFRKGKREDSSEKPSKKMNGFVCGSHAALVESITVVTTDVKWIREKIEDNERRKQEEEGFGAVIKKLDELIKKS